MEEVNIGSNNNPFDLSNSSNSSNSSKSRAAITNVDVEELKAPDTTQELERGLEDIEELEGMSTFRPLGRCMFLYVVVCVCYC